MMCRLRPVLPKAQGCALQGAFQRAQVSARSHEDRRPRAPEGYVTWNITTTRCMGTLSTPRYSKLWTSWPPRPITSHAKASSCFRGFYAGRTAAATVGSSPRKTSITITGRSESESEPNTWTKLVFKRLTEYVEQKGLLQGLLTRMTEHKDFGLHLRHPAAPSIAVDSGQLNCPGEPSYDGRAWRWRFVHRLLDRCRAGGRL